MTPEQMNFDRHWATGVKFADSTVVRCIQDVWALPEVADSVLSGAQELTVRETVPGHGLPCFTDGGTAFFLPERP